MKGVVCSSYSPRKYYYVACITISNTTFHFLLWAPLLYGASLLTGCKIGFNYFSFFILSHIPPNKKYAISYVNSIAW